MNLTPILTFAMLATPTETFTIHPVPGEGDFISPAEALASPLVQDGDVLEVHPGTYSGDLLVDKAVELTSILGAKRTVLDAVGGGPVLEITAGATVRGFTITGAGGAAIYGGVLIDTPSFVLLADNVIAGNHPTGTAGVPCGGVTIAPGGSAVLERNDIRSNSALSVGGVLAYGSSSVDLIDNRIRGNGGGATIMGGVLFGASGRLVNNQSTGNFGTGIGGLVIAGGIGPPPFGASVEVVNCTIYGNKATSPAFSVGGVLFDDGGAVTIRNTLVHSNAGTTGMDLHVTSDFGPPPATGVVDLDYSHVMIPGPVTPGPHMVPYFTAAELLDPATAIAGPVAGGSFQPRKSSPDVDAGLSSAFPGDLVPLDLDGKPRVVGSAIDVGAFEHGRLRSGRL